MGTFRTLSLAAAATLALAACGPKVGDAGNIAALDNELAANTADATLSNELASQIAVDANMVGDSGASRAVKTPPANSERVAAATPQGTTGGCRIDVKFAYGSEWANRLPQTFPVYPGAKVTEAAGNDSGACRMRVVSFTTGENWQRLLDWYNTQAVRAGYSSEHQLKGADHILAGTRGDAAYYLIVTPKAQGSDASLIVNNGR